MKYAITSAAVLIPLAMILFIPTFYQPVNLHASIEYDTKKGDPSNSSPSSKDTENNHTIEKLLKTSMKPVGSTLYIWGGAWNEEDTEGGIESMTIGTSDNWKTFFDSQDANYDFTDFAYQIHDGLDCSGFVGWTIYNTFYNENEKDNLVVHSGNFGTFLSSRGYGEVIPSSEITSYQPGDILFNNGHVYFVLGQYDDGSVLLVHSAPPGVRISGTPTADGNLHSQAISSADQLMKEHYPDFYNRYPAVSVDFSFLTDYDQFRWNESTMSDVNVMSSKTPEDIISMLFPS
ncbi:hypothetical protein [Ileibacterium valens]|uniref:hypothetical protein n=2 Tax=Ileibacterium valens TaxID=1862668 RepID=UPI0024BB43D3|nr:hypothetical protein [Ileibacterium valens]